MSKLAAAARIDSSVGCASRTVVSMTAMAPSACWSRASAASPTAVTLSMAAPALPPTSATVVSMVPTVRDTCSTSGGSWSARKALAEPKAVRASFSAPVASSTAASERLITSRAVVRVSVAVVSVVSAVFASPSSRSVKPAITCAAAASLSDTWEKSDSDESSFRDALSTLLRMSLKTRRFSGETSAWRSLSSVTPSVSSSGAPSKIDSKADFFDGINGTSSSSRFRSGAFSLPPVSET